MIILNFAQINLNQFQISGKIYSKDDRTPTKNITCYKTIRKDLA